MSVHRLPPLSSSVFFVEVLPIPLVDMTTPCKIYIMVRSLNQSYKFCFRLLKIDIVILIADLCEFCSSWMNFGMVYLSLSIALSICIYISIDLDLYPCLYLCIPFIFTDLSILLLSLCKPISLLSCVFMYVSNFFLIPLKEYWEQIMPSMG